MWLLVLGEFILGLSLEVDDTDVVGLIVKSIIWILVLRLHGVKSITSQLQNSSRNHC